MRARLTRMKEPARQAKCAGGASRRRGGWSMQELVDYNGSLVAPTVRRRAVYFRLCVFILHGFVVRSDYEEEIAALYRASKMVCVLAASSAFKLFKTAEPVEPVRPLAAV